MGQNCYARLTGLLMEEECFAILTYLMCSWERQGTYGRILIFFPSILDVKKIRDFKPICPSNGSPHCPKSNRTKTHQLFCNNKSTTNWYLKKLTLWGNQLIYNQESTRKTQIKYQANVCWTGKIAHRACSVSGTSCSSAYAHNLRQSLHVPKDFIF